MEVTASGEQLGLTESDMDEGGETNKRGRAHQGQTPISVRKPKKKGREEGASTKDIPLTPGAGRVDDNDGEEVITVGSMQKLLDAQTQRMQSQIDTMMAQMRLQTATEIAELREVAEEAK
eukprot:3103732-Karenia_brevis.AAC.1